MVKTGLSIVVLAGLASMGFAQEEKAEKESRLQIGGYGEAVMTRNFFSQSFNRYNAPERYNNDDSHGRFDLPHVTFYLGYDFGHGWSLGSEIEFEHGGNETAVEIEAEESGEYEAETEKGGEVALEQFWLNKAFWKGRFNIKAGEIIVPVGYSNAHHEPLNFFTCYRPEGEATILPNTWHQLGLSLWGRINDWGYEAQFLSGLNSESFTAENFAHQGATSPYEFKVANSYAAALRIDNYSVKGLRLGVSGYYGKAMHNSFPHDLEGDKYNSSGENEGKKQYDNVKGVVAIGSADFTLNRFNWIVRGNVDYGYVGDAATISSIKRNLTANNAPYKKTPVGKNALAYGIEAGYDVFSQWLKMRADNQTALSKEAEHE